MFLFFEKVPNMRKYCGFVGVSVKEIVMFNIGSGLCVLNSIWEHRLKIFSTPKIEKNKKNDPTNRTKSQKCEQSPYGPFGGIFLGYNIYMVVGQ